MDKLDTKILHELLLNSRQPLSKIGKAVNLSRENVHYRIQRLSQQKIIKDFVTEINHKKLEFTQHTIFLKYKKITQNKEKELIQFLQNTNAVSWIGLLTGKWSITFDIYTKNNESLNKILTNILTQFKENIGDYLTIEKIDSTYYFNKIINEEIPENKTIKKQNIKHKIDNTDIELLKKFNQDTRIPYTEISNTLKLTPNGIKQRYKKLKENKYILGHTISINHKAFNLEWQGLQLKIINHNEETEKKLKEFFKTNEKIIFYYQYTKTGIYDFDIGVIIKNSNELRNFINKLRSEFYEEVDIYDTFLVLEEVSSHRLPKIVFE